MGLTRLAKTVLWAVGLALLAGCSLETEGFSLDTAEQPAQSGLPQGTAITLIRLSPNFSEDGTIFVGTKGHGIFRSDNSGLSWEAMVDGIESLIAGDPHFLSVPPVLDITLSPSFAEDGEAYFASYLGLHYSNDWGVHWQLLEDTPFYHTIDVMLSPEYGLDRTVYVTASEKGPRGCYLCLFRSTDAGASWSGRLSYVGVSPYVEVLPDGSLVSAGGERLNRSTDRGERWTRIYTGDITSAFSISPNFLEDGIAFFAVPAGGNRNVKKLLAWEGRLLDSGLRPGGSYICHREGYGAYCPILPFFSPTFKEDGTIFAFGGLPVLDHRGVIKSVDRGITWEAVEFPISKHFVSLAFSPNYSEDQTLYVATRHGLFVSRNGGDDWEQLASTFVEEDKP